MERKGEEGGEEGRMERRGEEGEEVSLTVWCVCVRADMCGHLLHHCPCQLQHSLETSQLIRGYSTSGGRRPTNQVLRGRIFGSVLH